MPEYLKYSGPWCSLYESCFTDAFCLSALTVTDPRRGAGEDLRVARLDLPNAGATLMLAMEASAVELAPPMTMLFEAAAVVVVVLGSRQRRVELRDDGRDDG